MHFDFTVLMAHGCFSLVVFTLSAYVELGSGEEGIKLQQNLCVCQERSWKLHLSLSSSVCAALWQQCSSVIFYLALFMQKQTSRKAKKTLLFFFPGKEL